MPRQRRRFERYRAWRKSKSRVGRLSIHVVELILLLWIIDVLAPGHHGLIWTAIFVLALFLIPLFLVLISRWVSRRVLWKVRNRLIVTYLLMGLAPIVLFGTLTAITAYLVAGQFATDVALLPFNESTAAAEHQAKAAAVFLLLHGQNPVNATGIDTGHDDNSDLSLWLLQNNTWHPLGPSQWNTGGDAPFSNSPVSAWMHPGFKGIVALQGKLYLVAEAAATQGPKTVTTLATTPLDAKMLNLVAKPLGHVILSPGILGGQDNSFNNNSPGISLTVNDDGETSSAVNSPGATRNARPSQPPAHGHVHVHTYDEMREQPHGDQDVDSFDWIRGGAIPPKLHFYDIPVAFSAPVPMLAWTTGEHVPGVVTVISRATTLWAQLFASSVQIGLVVRIILISLACAFALIEFFALWMALHLGRTITCSVADLYKATAEIDRGNLEHRIVVKRRDQLGALSSSFNRMAESLKDLLAQQREKDRLLSELAIAQEVQRNLFPHSPVSLPGLELHAVCIPARSVSGDYFDFIFRRGNQICLALGDISGKGISAALLMASLNSAVRAFSLENGNPEPIPSPAHLLALLNKHLYQSTQPEKYATLFLAVYNTATQQLTYANAGHLPPVIMSSDGNMRKLDCGGSVVGLLEGLAYEEETIQLHSGDLLLAYSDGLTEPENASGEFGEQRLFDCVSKQRLLPLPALAAFTLETLQQWIGDSEQPDDMTIMLARQL